MNSGRSRAPRDPQWPTAGTRGLAVLGWPVGHSLSPAIHNRALCSDELDLVYLALPVPPARLLEVVAALGVVGFVGANVTVPHKQTVMAACDRLTVEAQLVGAVNTLHWHDGRLEGHNTDTVGLRRALDEVEAGTGPAVLLGTGGAARAAVVALVRRGASVTVVGRREDAASEVARIGVAAGGTVTSVTLEAPELPTVVVQADVVVNATPLGMHGEPLPAPFMELGGQQTAYDLVYAPPDTPFLNAAAGAGARAHHGLSMLVHQAAASYEAWTEGPAPIEVMRAAALAGLAARAAS